jgi:hypothetical protein
MKIYHVAYCGDFGEADAFYNEAGELIHWWSNDDASWSGEYMGPLMEHVGVEVLDGTRKMQTHFKKHMKELFGDE